MTPTLLIHGPDGELRNLVETLLAPYHTGIATTSSDAEAVAVARRGDHLVAAILLPDPRVDQDELIASLREASPGTRIVRLERFVPGLHARAREVGVEVDLDAIEVSELIEATLGRAEQGERTTPTANDERRDVAVAIILALSNVIESLKYLNVGSSRPIMHDALRVGRELGLSPRLLDELALSALLQDVGMLYVDRSYAGARPADLEAHVRKSAEIANSMDLPWNLEPLILAHHEHYDGLGYPRGLRGSEIPIGARILMVVSSFHAMIGQAPGRSPLSRQEATEELVHLAGRQFDPEIVEIFVALAADPELEPSDRRVALVGLDDETRGQLVLKFLRASYGVWFLTADRDSVEALHATVPTALIIGIDPAGTGGLEMLHWIRQDPLLVNLPVIALIAGSGSESNRQLAIDMGASDALIRPISPREVVTRVGGFARRLRRLGDTVDDVGNAGEALRGRLEDRPIADICQMLRAGYKTALVRLRAGGVVGSLYVADGRLVHAETQQEIGEAAFLSLVRQGTGMYTISHGIAPPRTTIHSSLHHLLMSAAIHDADLAVVP